MLKELLQWDRDTFIYLNNLGIEEYDGFWSIVTEITTWIPLFILFIYLIFSKFNKNEAIRQVLTLIALVGFITLVTHLTKIGVARLRPTEDPDVNTLIRILKSPTGFSFFSGHSSSSFSITVLMFLFLRNRFRGALLFFIWPLLFATSRIFVGVHYPLDIIVGTLVGIFSGILFYTIYVRYVSLESRSVRLE